MAITARGLKTLAPGKWLVEAARGEGQLRVKGGTTGAHFYFRYQRLDHTRADLPLGRFDPNGSDGLTLADAKVAANEWRRRYRAGERDLHAARKADVSAQEAAHKARAAAELAARRRSTRTLGALLTAYTDQMQRDGKVSAKIVRGALDNHVRTAWPELWAMPLSEVDMEQLLSIVAKPAHVGHLREAERIRAYLRAAFAAGIRAGQDALALPALRALKVTSNPARDLVSIKGANRARTRALSLAELRAYWRRIRAAPEYAVLRFHLLTGCQRIRQLGRATKGDLDDDVQGIHLLDPKGRRETPRQHFVPLLPVAAQALADMHAGSDGPFLFTVTAGRSGATYFVVHDRLREVVQAMVAADELPGGSFTPGDLRRTVETQLAGAHISKDVRGQLQSHGLNGVQARHYDMYEYLAEKRAALETLYNLLTVRGAQVVPIRRSAD